MKLFISTFTVALLALSVNSIAGEPSEITKKVIRTLNCNGVVDVDGEKVAITAKISDTKYTEKFEDGESFDEYGSTLTVTDAEQPSKSLLGEITSTDTSEDIAQARQTESGPAYYALSADKNTKPGLLIVACDVDPKKSACRKATGKATKHAIAIAYSADETKNFVADGSRQYPGEMTCTVQ